MLYNTVTEEQFARCGQGPKYRKLLFALSWFHSVLLERRKFKALGWNIPYEFNESDFSICHDIIIVFLDAYPERTPFDAMRWACVPACGCACGCCGCDSGCTCDVKPPQQPVSHISLCVCCLCCCRYLIAEANYGGRVTDDWDRRLVNVYIRQFICEPALDPNSYRLSELPEYFLPPDGPLNSYFEYIQTLPQADDPMAFGQHLNADIASQMEDAKMLLQTIVGLQPTTVVEGAETPEQKALRMAILLEEQVPEGFDLLEVKAALGPRSEPDPMKTVLMQELERYNMLLSRLSRSLSELQKAVQGLVAITPDLEQISESLQAGSVPESWSFCYPSLKPLGMWMSDLVARIAQMQGWATTAMPRVFWMSGFTYPTGFLTALLQTSARKNGIPIDTLGWDFGVTTNFDDSGVAQPPKEGAYIKGLFLEGARWDVGPGNLTEPLPMELSSPMPFILFKPVDNKKKVAKGVYTCPTYLYPVRTGTRERPSFMIACDLKSGLRDGEFWTKRGVAMLLALAM
jgi:dynein heavy chain